MQIWYKYKIKTKKPEISQSLLHVFPHSDQTEPSWCISKGAVKTKTNRSHWYMCHTHCERRALLTGALIMSLTNDQHRPTRLTCNTSTAHKCMHMCVCVCVCVCVLYVCVCGLSFKNINTGILLLTPTIIDFTCSLYNVANFWFFFVDVDNSCVPLHNTYSQHLMRIILTFSFYTRFCSYYTRNDCIVPSFMRKCNMCTRRHHSSCNFRKEKA